VVCRWRSKNVEATPEASHHFAGCESGGPRESNQAHDRCLHTRPTRTHDDDRRVAQSVALAHFRDHRVTVHVRHQEIEQYGIGFPLAHDCQRLDSARRLPHLVASTEAADRARQQAHHVGAVVDDENGSHVLAESVE
jgi:hypothetical protein